MFARSAYDELILGHVTSLPDIAHFEQVFAWATPVLNAGDGPDAGQSACGCSA